MPWLKGIPIVVLCWFAETNPSPGICVAVLLDMRAAIDSGYPSGRNACMAWGRPMGNGCMA
jgi:hypothetical protein